MLLKKSLGQEAVEFILISSVVLLGALATMLVFSGKIAEFFTTGSSVVQVANQKAPTINENSNIDFQTEYTSELSYTSTMVDGNEVRTYDDKSVAFLVNNQAIRLPTRALELQNTVIQATGSSGTSDLIREIAYLINKYKPKTPDVEVFFGSGVRSQAATTCSESKILWFSTGKDCNKTLDTYVGDAKVQDVTINATIIKLDNHIILIQNDQSTSGSGSYKDKYRIEGDISSDNSFEASFKSYSKNVSGTYSSKIQINKDGGLLFNDGSFTQGNIPENKDDELFLGGLWGSVDTSEVDNNGDWNFNFEKTIFKYELDTKN